MQSILNDLEEDRAPRNSHSFESRRKVDSILSTLDGEEGEEDELSYPNPQQQQHPKDSFAGKDPRRRSQQPQQLQQSNYLPPPPMTPPPAVMDESHGFRSSNDRPHTGPLSPFSPLFHRRKRPRPAVVLGMQQQQQHVGWKDDVDHDDDANEEDVMDLSLSICRKVSVVVTVLRPSDHQGDGMGVGNKQQREQQEQQQVCLFPVRAAAAAGETSPRDLMIVNPTALGQHIPVQMTMETARLLSETTANTTDWARTYKFHQVVWQQQSSDSTSFDSTNAAAEALRNIAQAVTNDMQAPGSIAHRILIGMGSSSST